jgi:hypothetical protein
MRRLAFVAIAALAGTAIAAPEPTELLRTANELRFTQRQPDKAREVLERLIVDEQQRPTSGFVLVMARVALADLLEFERDDRNAAAGQLEAAAKAMATNTDQTLAPFLQAYFWVAPTASALRAGAPAKLPVTREATRFVIAATGLVQMFGMGHPPIAKLSEKVRGSPNDRSARAELLEGMSKMPASRQGLLATLPFTPLMPDESAVEAYLARHDPAGVVSSAFLAWLASLDPARDCDRSDPARMGGHALVGFCDGAATPVPVARVAKRRIESGAILVASHAPDPRLSSIDATWKRFMAGLQSADREELAACLTPKLNAKFREPFRAMSDADLRAWAASVESFKPTMTVGRMREAAVTRRKADGLQAYLIYFQEHDGNWLISEM